MLLGFSSARLCHRFLSLPSRQAISLDFRSLSASTSLAQVGVFSAHQSNFDVPDTPCAFVKLISEASKSWSLSTGESSHTAIIKLGLTANVFVATALLGLYFKCSSFGSAEKLFNEMPHRNVVTWSTLIHGLSQCEHAELAFEAFCKMLLVGISPSSFSISSVLAACSHLRDPMAGALLHCIGLKLGFCSNVVVGTSLVDMYSKCSRMCDAKRLFDGMHQRNVVTWTSLVTGYAQHQKSLVAMLLVREMKHLGIEPNKMTYNSLLSSFWRFEDLIHGKQVHCAVIKEGLDSDSYIAVSLVSMYSKCGSLEDFMKAGSNNELNCDQVSFNSIIAGLSHLGNGSEVLVKFLEMRKACLEIDVFTFASVLRAIALLSALQEGRKTHALILKSGHFCDVCIRNGLVTMYAKCSEMNDSKQIFSSINEPNLVSWNSLLSGCAHHGYGKEALELFEQMRRVGVKPDSTTYLSVLSACSHVGFVEKGLEYFHQMKEEDPPIVSGMEHYACVVNLLGRAGYLHEAESFIMRMPIKPGVSVYKALLSGCQVHRNVEIAKRVGKCVLELCPDDSGSHVLLSNVFEAAGCWNDAIGIRKLMRGKRVRKNPGWSWIEGRIASRQASLTA